MKYFIFCSLVLVAYINGNAQILQATLTTDTIEFRSARIIHLSNGDERLIPIKLTTYAGQFASFEVGSMIHSFQFVSFEGGLQHLQDSGSCRFTLSDNAGFITVRKENDQILIDVDLTDSGGTNSTHIISSIEVK